MPPTFLDDDLDLGNNFKDSVLMGLDSLINADLKGFDDVINRWYGAHVGGSKNS